MAGSSRSGALIRLLLLLGWVAAPAAAQTRVEGLVLRPTAFDTVAVAGARVVLHRVGREVQGPLDSARTDARGGFRFALPADTTAIYLISARHHGIEYFAEPLLGEDPVPRGPLTILVADTSSTSPIGVAGRYLVIGAPGTDRQRTAVDLVVLVNDTRTTRVGRDTLSATWSGALPVGAISHRVPEMGSEVSPDAVRFRGDTVDVLSPLSPGTRQLLVEHLLPAELSRLIVPLGGEAGPVQVVTEEPGATVTGGSLSRAEAQVIDGRPLDRWIGTSAPGDTVVIIFPAPGSDERTVVLLLVLGTVLALALGLWLGLRRRIAARSAGPPA